MKTVKGGVRVPPWKLRSAGPASQPANIHPGPTGPGTALDTGSATEKQGDRISVLVDVTF